MHSHSLLWTKHKQRFQTIYGYHAVSGALRNLKRHHRHLKVTEKASVLLHRALPDALLSRVKIVVCAREQLDRLCPQAQHQGMLLTTSPLPALDLNSFFYQAPHGPYVLLDHVTDPHNGGAVFRSCCALGACGVIVPSRQSVDLISPVLNKVASGAMEHLPVCVVPNVGQAITTLHKRGLWTLGLAEDAEPIDSVIRGLTPEKMCIMIGSEGEGLRQLTCKRASFLGRLPTESAFGTLNVAVAAALALYRVRNH